MSTSTGNLTPNQTAALEEEQQYDPNLAVPYWHQDMELATICIANALTLLLIITRVWVRRRRLKRFRADDIWIMVAGGILVFPYWVCQIGTNRYGSGLHVQNIPNSWLIPFFEFEWGWTGYYIVASMIKVSVCVSLLEILPHSFTTFRKLVYLLCAIILGLGFAEACTWLFQCQPFLSNFVYSIEATWCLNIDQARYAWVGLSIGIDLCIVSIPYVILRQIRLKAHERTVLFIVFGANLLGTITCAVGAYGIWLNRNSNASQDLDYSESVYIMCNDIEIFMYTFGASATMLSRYMIHKSAAYASDPGSRGSQRFSWYRTPTDPFSTGQSNTIVGRGSSANSSRFSRWSHGGKRSQTGGNPGDFDLVESPVNAPEKGRSNSQTQHHKAGVPVLYDLGGLVKDSTQSSTSSDEDDLKDEEHPTYIVTDMSSYRATAAAGADPELGFASSGEMTPGIHNAAPVQARSGPIWDWESRAP